MFLLETRFSIAVPYDFGFRILQVSQIKQRIEHELKLGEAPSQKIIHAGKILKDDQTLESAKLVENDFLVVMISAPKAGGKKDMETDEPAAAGAAASSSAAAAPSQPASASSTPAASAASSQPASQPAASSPPAPAAASSPASSAPASGAAGAGGAAAPAGIAVGSILSSVCSNDIPLWVLDELTILLSYGIRVLNTKQW